MNQHFVFVHGWGYSPSFWKPLKSRMLDCYITTVDLGFFTHDPLKTAIPSLKLQKNVDTSDYVAVGHSLGLFYLLEYFPNSFRRYVAINSFACFTQQTDFSNGVADRILEQMQKRLANKPKKVLSDFYQQCGEENPVIPDDWNLERLQQGLEWLKTGNFLDKIQAMKSKLTVIASNNDPIVNIEMTKDSFKNIDIHWFNDSTHLLPHTQINNCVSILKLLK